MTLFYIGLNPRFQQYSWLPNRINAMFSAAGYWDQHCGGWRKSHRFFPSIGSRWLDCGGFTMLNKYGDYPFMRDEYLNLVAWLHPDFYATMDYPCEPDISRKMSLSTNRERIMATVKNAEWFKDHYGMLGNHSVCVPIIQGYTLDEYKSCIDEHAQVGTIAPYMAVGSMCRRISSDELHKLIPGIYDHARQAGCSRLHYFGLKLSKGLIDLGEFIYSQDSAVALDDYDNKLRQARDDRRWPSGQKEKKIVFYSFLKRLDSLGLIYQ